MKYASKTIKAIKANFLPPGIKDFQNLGKEHKKNLCKASSYPQGMVCDLGKLNAGRR